MITINNLSCKYDKTILENINLTIDENKITYIIGKNGSGKSTLANILTGLNKKYKGEITIDELKLTKKTEIKELRKKIGMVFQNPDNQIIFSNIYDDMKFTLTNLDIPKEEIDKKIKETLKIVDMENHQNKNAYVLSGGEKQRVAIASVLASNPKYIIFDEATSMLDVNGKNDIYKLVKKLKKRGIGVIFITNITDEIIYADDILIIDNKNIYKYKKEEIIENHEILSKHHLKTPFNIKIMQILKEKGIDVSDEESIIKEIGNL